MEEGSWQGSLEGDWMGGRTTILLSPSLRLLWTVLLDPSHSAHRASLCLGITSPGLCKALGLGELEEGDTRQPQPCSGVPSSQRAKRRPVLAHEGPWGRARQAVLKTSWPP